MGDVGQGSWEEIDYTPRQSPGLENYGWDLYEGRAAYEPKSLGPGLGKPIFVYDRDNGCSVTGGFVYRGAAVSSARGRCFFGDYCSGRVWSTKVVGGEARCAGRGDPRRRAVLVRRGRDRRALPDLARRLGLQARTLSPIRCRWVPEADPAYVAYHDDEWGVPLHGERELFELLTLEGAQAGLMVDDPAQA